ncbi:2-hydroxyhepta-2,4-diene-1,7-dioate isomerase [Pedobacter sp. PACM 27299]|uniref:fumarylacetoacetate hydrolase family protein n=1 Tax=Pedobacter sp. PACM 27299 TaxID=1727164 RepID=UPI0007061A72|nr:fumarylacetoacetate hydrolase family protein [Pedobacter sp. PACM 27299]ALL08022.1 2-hydroxyhepta-2,4-diene-1,7-dioate isomerase [Pedobacter sp. PACM 27299]
MKIIAIGRNYAAHAKELNNPIPGTPVIFLKPDTAALRENKPFYIPEFSSDIHYELEVVLKICREGKHIAEKFAGNYFEEVGLGIDFTARDIQTRHKEKGLPWELAKAFDHSAAVSAFVPKGQLSDLHQLPFELQINGEPRQKGNTKDMIFSFEYLISFISQYFTLKKGDLIFTGTPEGVGQVHEGDKLEAWMDGHQLLNFDIK